MILPILVILLVVFMLGCTVTVTPIPKQKASPRSKHHTSSRNYPSSRTVKRNVPPDKPVTATNIKETWWIENYKKLESAHGDYEISDDARIEPLPDGRFRVPDTVLSHYQDMLMAKPSPKP